MSTCVIKKTRLSSFSVPFRALVSESLGLSSPIRVLKVLPPIHIYMITTVTWDTLWEIRLSRFLKLYSGVNRIDILIFFLILPQMILWLLRGAYFEKTHSNTLLVIRSAWRNLKNVYCLSPFPISTWSETLIEIRSDWYMCFENISQWFSWSATWEIHCSRADVF